MRFKAVTVGIVLAGTALGSTALTLGRARGAAWIGQPLELVVPVQVDPGQTDSALCADADVFHGDSRQDSSRVLVQVQPTDQPETFNLKISSTALIDEPVVTVYLRAGCSQKSSRKYVLLAEFPNENAAPSSRVSTPTAPQVPLVIPVQAAPVAAASSQSNVPATDSPKEAVRATKPIVSPAATAPKATAKEPVKTVNKEAAKEAPKASATKKESPPKAEKPVESAKPVAAGKPRLRLDPIETLSERVKSLEASTTGTTTQDDMARDSQKMQALQSDLKTLLEQAVKNEANLMAMRERLEKAESDRVPVALVYGLVVLVLLCLGALAFLWTRRAKNPEWEGSAMTNQRPSNTAMPARAEHNAAASQQDVDVDMVDMHDEAFDQLMGQAELEKKNA